MIFKVNLSILPIHYFHYPFIKKITSGCTDRVIIYHSDNLRRKEAAVHSASVYDNGTVCQTMEKMLECVGLMKTDIGICATFPILHASFEHIFWLGCICGLLRMSQKEGDGKQCYYKEL